MTSVGQTPHRTIYLNNDLANAQQKFRHNKATTSKYTILNFLPKTLFEQFQRIANVFFLFIAVLQQIPDVSPLGNGTTALTLFIVMGFTSAKEAFEDYKRHKNDREVNKRQVLVGRNGEEMNVDWKDVKVGDLCFVTNEELFPADLLLLTSSEPQGMCYIETSNLDGETNLKIRRSLPVTYAHPPEALKELNGELNCDAPNSSMYHFEGHLRLWSRHDPGAIAESVVTNNQMLLRESRLRNTRWVWGLVVYTGRDTKIYKSSSKVKIKRSRVERLTNYLIIAMFILVTVICLIMAVLYGVWIRDHSDDCPYLDLRGLSGLNEGLMSFLTFVILFSNFIPISLYVTLETVKFGQSKTLESDMNMYCEEKDQPVIARTSNLNEELGQVEYIFSDKTGTLTCNCMEFVHCTIGGVAYGRATGNFSRPPPTALSRRRPQSSAPKPPTLDHPEKRGVVEHFPASEKEKRIDSRLGALSASSEISDTTELEPSLQMGRIASSDGENTLPGQVSMDRSTAPLLTPLLPLEKIGSGVGHGHPHTERQHQPPTDRNHLHPPHAHGTHLHPNDALGTGSTPAIRNPGEQVCPMMRGETVDHVSFQDENDRFASKMIQGEPLVNEFLTLLSVCHTVIPDLAEDKLDINNIRYEAASPDEGCLVAAARFFGHTLHTRTPSTLIIDVNGVDVSYELLALNGFDSTRKRMSCVVRHPDGRIVLYVKGADTLMYALLEEGNEINVRTLQSTKTHVDKFAAVGLRTLLLAYRDLTEEEYVEWSVSYQEAANTVHRHEENMHHVAKAIERNLVLIGATAIEDRLQDAVPQTITALRNAGIKVWVLTGDKQETAIMIGYSASILSNKMDVIILGDEELTPPVMPVTHEEMAELLGVLPEELPRHITLDPIGVATLGQLSQELRRMDEILQNKRSAQFACVVDGATLERILGPPKESNSSHPLAIVLRERFLQVVTRCRSVIGCRASPAQKAQVVEFMQTALHPVTLAIGDGANDVDMIRAANIGVGIMGVEGGQAALSADYAIGQFRYLQPLLLVHGHWCYHRISTLIGYFFYKNTVIAFLPIMFQFVCAFSGQTFAEKWTLSFYNTFFTSLPIIVVGLWDQVLDRKTLLRYPPLYTLGTKNVYFKASTLTGWIITAVYQAAVIFVFHEGVLLNGVFPNGQTFDLFYNGNAMFTTCVIVVTLRLAIETSHWTVFNFLAMLFMIVIYFAWMVLFSLAAADLSINAWDQWDIGTHAVHDPVFWLLMWLSALACLLPDMAYQYYRRWHRPRPADIVRELRKQVPTARYALAHVNRFIQSTPIFPSELNTTSRAFVFDEPPAGHAEIITQSHYPVRGLRQRLRRLRFGRSRSSRNDFGASTTSLESPPASLGSTLMSTVTNTILLNPPSTAGDTRAPSPLRFPVRLPPLTSDSRLKRDGAKSPHEHGGARAAGIPASPLNGNGSPELGERRRSPNAPAPLAALIDRGRHQGDTRMHITDLRGYSDARAVRDRSDNVRSEHDRITIRGRRQNDERHAARDARESDDRHDSPRRAISDSPRRVAADDSPRRSDRVLGDSPRRVGVGDSPRRTPRGGGSDTRRSGEMSARDTRAPVSLTGPLEVTETEQPTDMALPAPLPPPRKTPRGATDKSPRGLAPTPRGAPASMNSPRAAATMTPRGTGSMGATPRGDRSAPALVEMEEMIVHRGGLADTDDRLYTRPSRSNSGDSTPSKR